jgi:hypothetical protein
LVEEYSASLRNGPLPSYMAQEVTRLSDLPEILHVPISAPTVRFHKIFETLPGFFLARCAKKKPGRASKICDKSRNVQILVHAKFQPNRTIGSQVIHYKLLGHIRGKWAITEGENVPKTMGDVCDVKI